MLKLKLQYFGHLMQRTDSLEKKTWCWERLKAGEKGENRGWDGWMASLTLWTVMTDGQSLSMDKLYEFEQDPGVSDGQGSLTCCSPWACTESHMTEWLNWILNNPKCISNKPIIMICYEKSIYASRFPCKTKLTHLKTFRIEEILKGLY